MLALLAFVAILIVGFLFKDMIETAILAGEEGNNAFSRMYKGLSDHEDEIFTTICQNVVRVQDCNETEKAYIFNKEIPGSMWYTTGALLEIYGDCSGLSHDEPLQNFYFTNYQK